MGIRAKMAAVVKRVPFRSEKVVVAEWESRAKYPEIGREAEHLRVFKFADGTGTVFLVKEETGQVDAVYRDDMSFDDDEIVGCISPHYFSVTELTEFHPPAARWVEEQFRVERSVGVSPVYHYIFVYSDGTGAVADLDCEDHQLVSPPRAPQPIETFEDYFDVERWNVTRIK
jgi:hypothetical protein